ncbi:MAG TPA: tRNA (adenosine(37)-N6)-threonylcarbamoyltransferase complex dimerization subunit type 1 TsaB [Clostridiales bacterium]|nr:tRNA (adenosine(37)-N6)-threonylcarbamoyltransferase complex dimerization subunit type 1 TsaB [Clostridiales bacterium]
MFVLALESTAKSASVALCRDGELICQYYQNSGLTHSRTLLPMVRDMLKNSEVSLDEVDLIAVAIGPGSFTGVRIGVSAAKGLAWAKDKPVLGVSTLEAMAWHGMAAPEGALICPVMDARRNQVYNALFEFVDGKPRRLCADRAVSMDDLVDEIKKYEKMNFLIGDGAKLCYNYLKKFELSALLPPEPMLYQSAWGVAMASLDKQPGAAGELLPKYLRLSQAERERQERMK